MSGTGIRSSWTKPIKFIAHCVGYDGSDSCWTCRKRSRTSSSCRPNLHCKTHEEKDQMHNNIPCWNINKFVINHWIIPQEITGVFSEISTRSGLLHNTAGGFHCLPKPKQIAGWNVLLLLFMSSGHFYLQRCCFMHGCLHRCIWQGYSPRAQTGKMFR